MNFHILPQDLRECMPRLSVARSEEYAPLLEQSLRDGQIYPVYRAAAFFAQIGHESIDLTHWAEIGGDRAKYAPYFGRGPIQLTWVDNYRKAGDALGLPLVQQPDLVLQPKVGFDVAVWFWKTRSLNPLCDAIETLCAPTYDLSKGRDTFDAISRRINGTGASTASLNDRWRRFQTCYRVMSTPRVVAPA